MISSIQISTPPAKALRKRVKNGSVLSMSVLSIDTKSGAAYLSGLWRGTFRTECEGMTWIAGFCQAMKLDLPFAPDGIQRFSTAGGWASPKPLN
jgi:hypothetical protein